MRGTLRHSVLFYQGRASQVLSAGAATRAQSAFGPALDAATPQAIAPAAASRTATAGGPAISPVSAQELAPGTATHSAVAQGPTFSQIAFAPGQAAQTAVANGPSLDAATPQPIAPAAASRTATAGGPTLVAIHVLRPGPAGREAHVFSDLTTPVAIPDLGTVSIPVDLTGETGVVIGFTLAIFIEHTYVNDLTLRLVSPTGTSYLIAQHGGQDAGSLGTADAPMVFTTTASTLFEGTLAADAPFTAQPYGVAESPISAPLAGVWTVEVSDTAALDVGTLNFLAVTFDAGTVRAGAAVVAGVAPEPAPPGDPASTPPPVPPAFTEVWRDKTLLGQTRPYQVVEVRAGRWNRGYRTIPAAQRLAGVRIPDETQGDPWMTWWTPAGDWLELPGVLETTITNNFEQNGLPTASITMENTRLQPLTGPTGLAYHRFERGFASPERGYDDPDRGLAGGTATEWAGRLSRQAIIRIWQGYGPPVRDADGLMPSGGGPNGAWTYVGQIDDVDEDTFPDRLVITARAGQTLTDELLFGWNKSRQLKDPIVFAAAAANETKRWIYTDDAADIVRAVLRWAGFRDWDVEDTGVPMSKHHSYDRATFLMDVIQDPVKQTGYAFFIGRPPSGESTGRAVFRKNASLTATDTIFDVTESDLLTDVQVKEDTEELRYIIRVRGKIDQDDGSPMGGDSAHRLMAVYRPPWSYQPGEGGPDRLAGLIKHAVIYDPTLTAIEDCEVAARMFAFYEALASYTATITIPGHVGVELDTQIGVVDSASAVNSRLWVTGYESSFTSGTDTRWTTTISGSLLDTFDIKAIVNQLQELTA